MRVTLIQPPNMQRTGKWKSQKVCRTPTNLALLASFIRQSGHVPRIVDLDIEGGTLEEIARLILANDPQVIGLTCLTPRFPITMDIAAECKRLNPGVIVVIGGPHVTGLPEYVLEGTVVDYGVIGEGEQVFLELIDNLAAGRPVESVANLIYRQKDTVKINPVRPFIADLDRLPFPTWDLLKLDNYVDPAFFKGPHLGLMSARGCPFDCYFCASCVVWGRRVRYRSPANMMAEIEEAIHTYGIREFMFYDDTFTLNRNRVTEFCDAVINRRLDIRFYAQVRVDTIDVEIAQKLKAAGCFAVAIGVESGNEQLLKAMGKNLTKEQIREGCKVLKQAKMPFLASYIIGHPGDTHETIRETLDFANELDADQSKFLIATPYPGTRFFQMSVERGILPKEGAKNLGDHTYFQHVAANLSQVSDEDLLAYQQQAFDDYDKRKRPLV
jgi:anaerobic magnesium-protoporphyrin IX monomethyl ester cyclase